MGTVRTARGMVLFATLSGCTEARPADQAAGGGAKIAKIRAIDNRARVLAPGPAEPHRAFNAFELAGMVLRENASKLYGL